MQGVPEAELPRITARTPDLNPIESIFDIIKKELNEEALKQEDCEDFCAQKYNYSTETTQCLNTQ